MNAKKVSGKKHVAVLLALVLVIGGTIGGTLAWLSAQTNAVTNTFTVGKITIDLKEHELKTDGTLDTSKEVTENKTYKVVPGGKQPKDPFVTVEAGSEKCYVYVLVTNNLVVTSKVEDVTIAETVAECNIYDNWEKIAEKDNSILYRSNEIVDASSAEKVLQVFSEVTYSGDKITEANISQLEGKTIEIDAYAHQSENTTQDVADAAALAHFKFPTT